MSKSGRPHVREGRENIAGGKRKYTGMSKENLYRPEVPGRPEWVPPKREVSKRLKNFCVFCRETYHDGETECPVCGEQF